MHNINYTLGDTKLNTILYVIKESEKYLLKQIQTNLGQRLTNAKTVWYYKIKNIICW